MIPTCFSAYYTLIPLLNEISEWSLLRKWSLSEVYRATLRTGESRIIKWGGSEMAGEAEIYQELVHPLQIKAPHIFEFIQLKGSGVFIMEDAGKRNLEQQPEPEYFLEASRELARLRVRATANLRMLPRKTIEAYSVSMSGFLQLLDDLLKSNTLEENRVLLKVEKVLPLHLEKLYQMVPTSLVHHDYHAKNLLIQEDGIMPIDWSSAYLSPHLGDLYCLITEAHTFCNLSKEDMISAYLEGTNLHINHLNWQVRIGGLCWLIKTLRWLVYGGIEIIPGSEAWIPDLLNNVENLCEELIYDSQSSPELV
ncbi:phosphotransferase [Paenibacillus sp. FSL L8-0470]|uniref:phosphotransferase n=1 Tax=Paenibacillus sp. FSL L8-0470 TaxID=2954688 RepID=UPI0030F78D90